MNKVLTLTIGIPAYNEEGNIGHLIKSLLNQRQDNFILKKIIVASDGSSDKTDEIVQSFKDERIILISDDQRKGQAARQNEIIDYFNEDLLLLLNADVLPVHDDFIENIVRPAKNDKKIGIVGGRTVPARALTFFEKVINYSVQFKEDVANKINHGNNIYFCHGAVRLFTKEYLRNFRFPAVVSEDAYSYFYCLKNGFKFVYEPKAEIYYRSPQRLHDHLRQSIRFFQGQKDLTRYIPEQLVRKEHDIPVKYLVGSSLKYLIKNPVLFLSYFGVIFWSKVQSKRSLQAKLVWETAESSKILK